MQAAFIVVFDQAQKFDPSRPFAPWLYAVVRRLALKRRARGAHRSRLWRQWRDPADDLALPSTEARVSASSDLALIRRELTTLPAMQRACFELVALRELSADDVAAMYDISPSTVRQHVFRARRTLRERLNAVLGPFSRETLDETGEI